VVAPGPGHKEAEVPGSIQVKAKANSRPWDRVRINRPAAGDKALLVAARPEVAEEVAVARVVKDRLKAEPADKFNHRVRGRLLLGRGAEPVAALVEKVVTNKPVNRGKGRDRLLKARQLVVAGERAVLAAVAKENAKVSSRQASKAKAADKRVFNSNNKRRRSNSNKQRHSSSNSCGRSSSNKQGRSSSNKQGHSSSNKQGHSSSNSNNFVDNSRAKVAAVVAVAADDERKVLLHRHRVNDTRQPEGRASSTAFPGRRASPRLIGGILGRVKVVRRGPFFQPEEGIRSLGTIAF
jgi:hypothetical protein